VICDLDGDGLQDLVVMDDLVLSVFYQDRAQGSRANRNRPIIWHLDHVLSGAKLVRGPVRCSS